MNSVREAKLTDREKVVEKLQAIDAYFRESFNAMDGTLACEQFREWSNAAEDAIALLKAQEPRVLTLEELEHAEVAYAEDIDKDEIIPILVNGRQHDRFNMVRARLGNSPSGVFRPSIFDYNKRWRCWTACPTYEQRRATPWP